MAKGSQLSQLKSALSQAGVTGNTQNGQKRKRSGAVEKDKDKKAAKLDEIQRRMNPFDVKVTKLKHDVGGRKVKGIVGRPAQSKQTGLEQRTKTLLKEYEEKHRSGGIVDRRFGENDPTMSLEERMLERFTKERQRSSKGATFNLEDEGELTHYGQSLSKMDDFDDIGLGSDVDEDDRGQIDREIVKKTHFGGFSEEEDEDEEPARKKSKAEVMAEVMAKSKEYKMKRQMEREQEDNVRHELDQNFDALRDLLYAPDPSSTGSNSVPIGRSRLDAAPHSTAIPLAPEPINADYDQHVRELAFDKRAKPKDRTKTEEELALEEKEALEKAERRRRKRMLGLDESESEDEGRSRGKRKRGGDDLEDDFADEGELGDLGAGLGEENAVDSSHEGENSDSVASGDSDEDETEGGSDDDSDGEEEQESDVGEHEDLVKTSQSTKGKRKSREFATKELPFTFPCPDTHEEFLDIVENLGDNDVPVVVQRIRALYHTSLGPDNKFKLQVLTGVLIDHILYITAPPSPRFGLLSSLLPHLITLTHSYPIQSADHFVAKLSLMYKNLKHGLSRGALEQGSKTWPGLPELTLLRVIGAIWPTSDLNHAVVSPTRLLMGAYLGLGRVRSLADVASGLFLCTLFLNFETLSKRLVPEAVNFLTNTVLHLATHNFQDASSLPGSFPSPDFGSEACLALAIDPKSSKNTTLRKANLVALLSENEATEQEKVDALGLTLNLLRRFADMQKGLVGFVELFEPISEVLNSIEKLPKSLLHQHQELKDTLTRLLKFAREGREPLRLQAHKPIPIPSYIPKFESTTSNYLRRQDPDHERNEASKLRNQYKQEKKGAIRELRKDAKFLAGVEQKKQAEKDRAYKERMGRVYGSIEGERAEEKAMEREKSRDKRRAGRK